MTTKLIYYIILSSIIFCDGGYFNGTSSGRRNLEASFTWNPFSYFPQGQTYSTISYGLTNKIDFHAYYSIVNNNNNNYYGGLLYQFLDNKNIDLATAIGLRSYNNKSEKHIFFPQLLYTIKFSNKIKLGGSFVNIREINKDIQEGVTVDFFITRKILDKSKVRLDLSVGLFSPTLWKSKYGDYHPTYSLDFTFK